MLRDLCQKSESLAYTEMQTLSQPKPEPQLLLKPEPEPQLLQPIIICIKAYLSFYEDMQNTFTEIYSLNSWHGKESISGTGSNLYQTAQIREYIIMLIKKYNITSVFDVPCGDFNWFKHIVQHIPRYIGADIVPELIEQNKKQYNHTFLHLDITKDVLPATELIFCRDLLVHLSYKSIVQALQNIKRSNAKYLLMTTFVNRQFKDIPDGGWRPISFFNAPFLFPKPLAIISENCTESYPSYIDKSLALWAIRDLPDL